MTNNRRQIAKILLKWWGMGTKQAAISELVVLIEKERSDAIQECYLQSLAVHCGDSECSEAIRSRFGGAQ